MSKLRHGESWYSRTKKELEEMDYKEKYRIALDKAKEIYEGQLGTATRIFLEQIFPELKESEDERIRKWIKKEIEDKYVVEGIINNKLADEAFAWLEKQKEPRDYRKLYEEVVNSDWFKENYKGKSLGEEQPTNSEIPKLSKPVQNPKKGCPTYPLSVVGDLLAEQKPKPEWTEEDEKMLSVITYKISQHQGNDERSLFTPDEAEFICEMEDKFKSLCPQPKEEGCDYITPNKKFFQWIYDRLVYVHKENPNMDYMMSFKKRIDNLVFDQYHWKPSEEQMEALQRAVNKLAKTDVADSVRLSIMYDNLKKLV